MLLAVPNIVLGIAILLNLFLLSLPIILIDVFTIEYLKQPNILAYYVLMGLFCFAEAKASTKTTEYQYIKTEKKSVPYLTGAIILIIFWLSLIENSHSHHMLLSTTIVGSLLIIFGIYLRVTAIRTLDQYFLSHIGYIEKHHLVTTHIYSWIRHPSELGTLLICCGVCLLLLSMKALIFTTICLLPIVLYRIHLEDALLSSLFPDEFLRYKEKTPSLLPTKFVK